MSQGFLYLVTGGAGFIGSHIVEELLARGERVRVLDNLSTGHMENIAHILEGVEFIEGDIRDEKALSRAMEGVDFCLHQAALPSVQRSVEDPELSNEVNVTGTIKVLLSAAQHKVKRLIYSSSSSVYGNNPQLPKREDMPPMPASPYAVSKWAAEAYTLLFSHLYDLETVALRYFNIFGPRQDPHSPYSAVIARFMDRMSREEAPIIFGDGSQTRDFTYVENAVHANLLACHGSREMVGNAFNIACSKNISLCQLVSHINSLMSGDLQPIFTSPRPGDVKHSLADISKAQRLMGYSPKVDFAEGLKRYIHYNSGGTKT